MPAYEEIAAAEAEVIRLRNLIEEGLPIYVIRADYITALARCSRAIAEHAKRNRPNLGV